MKLSLFCLEARILEILADKPWRRGVGGIRRSGLRKDIVREVFVGKRLQQKYSMASMCVQCFSKRPPVSMPLKKTLSPVFVFRINICRLIQIDFVLEF